MLTYRLDDKLPQGGRFILKMLFNGNIRSDLRGLYKSYFVNANNETKWLATTQFEANDARTAFPCFDEPSFKARIQLNITLRGEDNTALTKVVSNMPEAGREVLPNGNIVRY